MAASSCSRVIVDDSPNCVAVCKHTTSAANCPAVRDFAAADIASPTASLRSPWQAFTHAWATARSYSINP